MKKPPNPLVWILLSGVAFVVGAALCVMQFGRMSAQAAELADLRQALQDEDKIRRQLEEAETRLATAQADLRHLEMSVPEMAYIPTLLTEVEATGARNGILVTGVRPKVDQRANRRRANASGAEDGEQPKRPAYEETIIEVTGAGTYAAVLKFIQAVERFPKIVAVQRLNLAPKRVSRNEGDGQLELTAEFRLFAFPPVEPKAKPDGETEERTDLSAARQETTSDENG